MQGDRDAFTELVVSHDSDLIKMAFVITGDAVLAREAVQDAWHAAWRRRAQLRRPDQFRFWIAAIACNEARMRRRRAFRRRSKEMALDAAQSVESVDTYADPDLAAALARLSPEDREVLAYRFVLGWSSTDVAAATGLTPSGARVRLSRAVDKLRRELS